MLVTFVLRDKEFIKISEVHRLTRNHQRSASSPCVTAVTLTLICCLWLMLAFSPALCVALYWLCGTLPWCSLWEWL